MTTDLTLTTQSAAPSGDVVTDSTIHIRLRAGERWWGGSAMDGMRMPFGRESFERHLGVPGPGDGRLGAPSNQAAPVLVSTAGRSIASHRPFQFRIDEEELVVEGDGLWLNEEGRTLREAFLVASENFFPPSGVTLPRKMFSAPQYNTWIDQPYRPTQQSVLDYAHEIIASGMEPGVLIIDDSWSPGYGTWSFDEARFHDPADMVAELHRLGFSVMLWLVPFVSPDSAAFRELERQQLLVRTNAGTTAVRRWWNGLSAVLDLSNPIAVKWLTDQLDDLVQRIGIDGFKFDGGDVKDFHPDDITANPIEPVDFCEAWAQLGLRYPFNEYRACWRMGGQPLGQRLQDKPPVWGGEGLSSLIPEMLAQGMIGHPYTCPDMIGGGEIEAMSGQNTIDQEFFVRYAQLAAMSPMAQFSIAPARVLDEEHRTAVNKALALRAERMPTILKLVDAAARTGEPIIRPMAYHAPELVDVVDQFFLGEHVIVAPVLEPGAITRSVVLPDGAWRDAAGREFQGPATIQVACALTTIPVFDRA